MVSVPPSAVWETGVPPSQSPAEASHRNIPIARKQPSGGPSSRKRPEPEPDGSHINNAVDGGSERGKHSMTAENLCMSEMLRSPVGSLRSHEPTFAEGSIVYQNKRGGRGD